MHLPVLMGTYFTEKCRELSSKNVGKIMKNNENIQALLPALPALMGAYFTEKCRESGLINLGKIIKNSRKYLGTTPLWCLWVLI